MTLDDLEQLVFPALGEASACWDNLEGAGVFQSDRCVDVGRNLCEAIGNAYDAELKHLRDEVAALKAVAEAMRRTAAWHSPTVDDVE